MERAAQPRSRARSSRQRQVYSFNGVTVVDTSASSGPDVSYNPNNNYVSNALVYLTPPTSGPGVLTVTTPGGTSAGIVWNVINPVLWVALSDVASDPSKAVYVSSYTAPDPADQLRALHGKDWFAAGAAGRAQQGDRRAADSGAVDHAGGFGAGGSLVTNGYANPDRVDAINPSTGAVLASLILKDNLDANAGVYDASSGKLYLLRGNAN